MPTTKTLVPLPGLESARQEPCRNLKTFNLDSSSSRTSRESATPALSGRPGAGRWIDRAWPGCWRTGARATRSASRAKSSRSTAVHPRPLHLPMPRRPCVRGNHAAASGRPVGHAGGSVRTGGLPSTTPNRRPIVRWDPILDRIACCVAEPGSSTIRSISITGRTAVRSHAGSPGPRDTPALGQLHAVHSRGPATTGRDRRWL